MPRAGYICASYSNGHNVQLEEIKHLDSKVSFNQARLQVDDNTLAITLVVDRKRVPVFNHNPGDIWFLVREFGPQCDWYSTRGLVCWEQAKDRCWASLSLEPVDRCFCKEAAKARWKAKVERSIDSIRDFAESNNISEAQAEMILLYL